MLKRTFPYLELKIFIWRPGKFGVVRSYSRLASKREGFTFKFVASLKTYSAPWREWLAWCRKENLIANDPQASDVARYLGYLHTSKQLAPSTIKLHKSVISTMANPLKREQVSSHPLVRHILKAIDLSRPVPNKKIIWDVNTLVLWMKTNTVDQNSLLSFEKTGTDSFVSFWA